jgi:serine/threonine-protein kinase
MGAVLRGRDADLGCEIAVKVLLEQHCDKPEMRRRFVEEAQIGGQLQHLGVVPVYELGSFADSRPFFTMKLVDGRTLASLLEARRDPGEDLPRWLGIFEQVCLTVAYAHARGVIHRDLKPSNVMVGNFGEVQVMDWGLAKVLGGDGAADERAPARAAEGVVVTLRSGSNGDGSELGTPAYMAPEQARGEVDGLDERADVFGLGAILCEVLTGRPPYDAGSGREARRMAAEAALADALSRLDACGAEPELKDLAGRCLAAEARQRPRDAGEVARSMTAYREGVQERLRKAELERVEAEARAAGERKRRRLAVAAAAAVVALLATAGGTAARVSRERQVRAARVDVALGRARLLRDQAREAGDDVVRWAAARDAARNATEMRDDARDGATRALLAALSGEVEQGAQAAKRDHDLLARLTVARTNSVRTVGSGESENAAFADAFCGAGMDLDAMPPREAGALIRSRPHAVAGALAAALDEWAKVRRENGNDAAGARRLSEIAQQADPDLWRNQLRRALDGFTGSNQPLVVVQAQGQASDRAAALLKLAATAPRRPRADTEGPRPDRRGRRRVPGSGPPFTLQPPPHRPGPGVARQRRPRRGHRRAPRDDPAPGR